MEKHVIDYAGEMTRVRVWQETAIAAMSALIVSRAPSATRIECAPTGMESYARDVARAAYAIADEMWKQHGPSVSSRLQDEQPFTAAARAVDDEDEE